MVRLENPRPLTPEELEAYGRDGFAIVENLLTPAEVTALQDRVREYTHGDRSTVKLRIQPEPRVTRGAHLWRCQREKAGYRKITTESSPS